MKPPTATAASTKDAPAQRVHEKDGSTLVLIPGGEFTMGSDEFSVERPPHRVRVDPFWMGITEVTNAMYQAFVAATDHAQPTYLQDERFNGYDQPVVGVNWDDATAYCQWAGGRLPTEAEWEFAARGTDGRRYPWGNAEPAGDQAVFGLDPAKDQPTAVGSNARDVGPFGVRDLAGNVLEWCSDWAAKYSITGKVEANPTGAPQGTRRIMRGGCWIYQPPALRCTERLFTVPSMKRNYAGFRLVVDVEK